MKKVFYIVALVAIIAATVASPALAAPPPSTPRLNLSHIKCVEGEVEIHFVLLDVPDGVTPGDLTYTYGTVSPGAHTGNVWHFTDYKADGYYNVTSASVDVNGTTVTLHNPGDYTGTYDCDEPKQHVIKYDQELTCEGWLAWYTIDDGSKNYYANGGWTNGVATVAAYQIPGLNNEEVYNVTSIPAIDLVKPEACTPPPPPEKASASVDPTGNCQYIEGVGSLNEVNAIPNNSVIYGLPGGDIVSPTTLWLEAGEYPWSWKAKDGYEGSGEAVLILTGDCKPKPPKKIWVAICKFFGCPSALWENIFGGNPSWDSLDLYGDEDERPVAARILENCTVVNGGSRCETDYWIVVYGLENSNSDFDTIFDGVDFPAPETHQGADGKNWITYMNPVGETRWLPAGGARIPFENSADGWQVMNSGYRVQTHFYVPCCLAASYAFTSVKDGIPQAWKYPGMCHWAWVQFFVKIGLYPDPGEDNWAGWQFLFDQSTPWYDSFNELETGEMIAFPGPISELPK